MISASPLRPDFLTPEGWRNATLIDDAPVIGERSVVFEAWEGGFGEGPPVAVVRFINRNYGVELLFSGEKDVYDVKDVVDLAFKIAERLPDSPLPIEPIMVPSEVMDKETYDRYLTSIRIGITDQSHNQLLQTQTFMRDTDELCIEIDLASPSPPVTGAILDERSSDYNYKVTRLAPIPLEVQLVCNYGIVTLPEGSYRYKIWIGTSLVAEIPFVVQ
ncbi:MAG: hypothetical protein MUO76_17280 [Anaerolineaceae bacterium]|nr:hypothetical protein [Anaerolineaceae bacterium]